MKKVLMMMLCMGQMAVIKAPEVAKVARADAVVNTAEVARAAEEAKQNKNLNWLEMIARRLREKLTNPSLKSGSAVVKTSGSAEPAPVVTESTESQDLPEKPVEPKGEKEPKLTIMQRLRAALRPKPKPTFENLDQDFNKVNNEIEEIENKKTKIIADIDRQFDNIEKYSSNPEILRENQDYTEKNKPKEIDAAVKDFNANLEKLNKIKTGLLKDMSDNYPTEYKDETTIKEASTIITAEIAELKKVTPLDTAKIAKLQEQLDGLEKSRGVDYSTKEERDAATKTTKEQQTKFLADLEKEEKIQAENYKNKKKTQTKEAKAAKEALEKEPKLTIMQRLRAALRPKPKPTFENLDQDFNKSLSEN